MKIKSMLLIVIFIELSFNIFGQQYAVDRKATIFSGSGSIMTQGGDLFEDADGNYATTISFTPSVNHFVTKNFFIGGGMEFSVESQGDYSSAGIGVGPEIGFAFGGPRSTLFPYLDLGIRYYQMTADYGATDDYQISGSDISLGFGVIVPIKKHIGFIFEGGYHMLNLQSDDSDDSVSGNILSVGFGIAGLLFKDAEF